MSLKLFSVNPNFGFTLATLGPSIRQIDCTVPTLQHPIPNIPPSVTSLTLRMSRAVHEYKPTDPSPLRGLLDLLADEARTPHLRKLGFQLKEARFIKPEDGYYAALEVDTAAVVQACEERGIFLEQVLDLEL